MARDVAHPDLLLSIESPHAGRLVVVEFIDWVELAGDRWCHVAIVPCDEHGRAVAAPHRVVLSSEEDERAYAFYNTQAAARREPVVRLVCAAGALPARDATLPTKPGHEVLEQRIDQFIPKPTLGAESTARRRSLLMETMFAAAWMVAVVTRITFGFEIVSALGCSELAVDAALGFAPLLRWLYLVIERPFRLAHHALGIASVLVLVIAVRNVHEWQARSFLWRREASLLKQVDSLRDPANPVPASFLGFPVRVDRLPFRVYWPYSDWGLGSAGLVWDPAATLSPDSSAFGETVTVTHHLSGPWFFCGFT